MDERQPPKFFAKERDSTPPSAPTGEPEALSLNRRKTDALESIAESLRPDVTTNLVHLIRQQMRWSEETFGPGTRAAGVVAHLRKELEEVEADPTDIFEWIDVIILGLDGAWRSGKTAEEIVAALNIKYAKNFGRKWPDWRTASEDQPIEHIRDED